MDLQLEHIMFVNTEGGNIMRKFEYVDEAKKVCIIVLKDHFGNTISKGIARCSEDDTFDKEAGLKLANARAWKKYFDYSIKACQHDINRAKRIVSYYEEDITKAEKNLDILNSKRADLEKEIEELLAGL